MRSMDFAFLVTLDAASISGMLTLILRDSALLGVSLDIHIACLFALYATAPYGKFVHSVYRFAAILLDVVERRRSPEPLPIAEAT
jgi:citrate/tricarballylate utilization protein